MAGMKQLPPQFSVFALFVLLTAAAISFAIIRLPVPVIFKFLTIQSVVVCFLGWAVRNRKYPDPRQPPSPTSVRIAAAMNATMAGLMLAYFVWSFNRVGARPLSGADIIFWIVMSLLLVFMIWQVIRSIWPDPKPGRLIDMAESDMKKD